MTERIATGIPGFDDLIEGGLPKSSVTLVSGGPGTGKTILCSQFLWEGLQQGETCLFVTTEELPDDIESDAADFGWDLGTASEADRFTIEYMSPSDRTHYIWEDVQQRLTELEPDRVVIDSISALGIGHDDEKSVRGNLDRMIKDLRQSPATAVLTGEVAEDESGRLSRRGIVEFLVDAVVVLNYLGVGGGDHRSIEVRKIRKTNQEKDAFKFEITETGIHVYPDRGKLSL